MCVKEFSPCLPTVAWSQSLFSGYTFLPLFSATLSGSLYFFLSSLSIASFLGLSHLSAMPPVFLGNRWKAGSGVGRGNPLSFFLLSSHTLYFSLSHSSSPPTFSLFLFSCALSFSPTHTSSLFPSLSCPPLLPLSLYLLTLLLSYTLFYTHGSGGYRSFPLVIPLLISILKACFCYH